MKRSIALALSAAEASLLLSLLDQHIDTGAYWGGKAYHYALCERLFKRLTEEVAK